MYKKLIVVILLALLLSGCDAPGDDRVRSDFLKEHPSSEIVFIGVGEGDSDTAYYVIRYKNAGDGKTFTEEWQYLKEDKRGWVLNHRQQVDTGLSK